MINLQNLRQQIEIIYLETNTLFEHKSKPPSLFRVINDNDINLPRNIK